MLPEGFQWSLVLQHEKVPTSVTIGAAEVARLMQRLDGSWQVRLNCHRPMTEPLVVRDCESFESGKAGVEAWVRRHEVKLRAEVDLLYAGRRW